MPTRFCRIRKGFTYVELLVAGGILATITGLGIASVNKLQTQTSAIVYSKQLRSDIRSMQLAAMNGTTGTTATAAGVKIETNRYILFYGTSYDPNSTKNFVVNMDTPWQLTTTVDNSTIIFDAGSGNLSSIISGQRSITVGRTDTNETATIYINHYGIFQN